MARGEERKWDLGVGEAGVPLEWSWWCDIEDIGEIETNGKYENGRMAGLIG
jgi:hypothetical protein